MGYVDVSPPSIGSSSLKSAYKAVLDEGVCYSTDASADDEMAAIIKNMWLKNGVLTSRKLLADTGVTLDGLNIHSHIACFGYDLVHSGSTLYAVSSDGARSLYTEIPDRDSFFAVFSGKAYLYCGINVFSVDRDLNAQEEVPFCPVYGTNCSRDTGGFTRTENFQPNILAPMAKVIYDDGINIEDYSYRYPRIMDKTKKFFVYIDDRQLDESEYTVDVVSFKLNENSAPKEGEVVSVCFYSNDKIFDKCGIIAGCRTAETFGGSSDGTRVIAAGNPEYPGRFFYSEPSEPLSFKEDLFGTAGNGTEDITAFSKQYSDLIVFTENTVNRIKYNYTSDTGGYFSVHHVNSGIGCDMPESVASVENRTVFANSKRGIYIVDSVDGYDMLNVLPISKNITDDTGKKGYFSVDEALRKKGSAAVIDGKFMLLCHDRVFIWDFANSPYISSSDYVRSARKLTWFEFDGFEAVKHLFTASGTICAVKTDDNGDMSLYAFSEKGEGCEYSYKSGSLGLSYSFDEKYVINFRAGFKSLKRTSARISLYADGVLYASFKAAIEPDKDGYAVFFARLPKYSAKRFAFEISNSDPDVGITDVAFEYITRKNINNYLR